MHYYQHSAQALDQECNCEPEELRKTADLYADIRLHVIATAARACIDKLGGNANTTVIKVLAPKLLVRTNILYAQEKESAGTFRFIVPDSTGIQLRPLKE